MKKQDYLLFAIIIIAFIIWMYIVQKYFTVSYDELPIEEKIRYEQFMLPWKESERMINTILKIIFLIIAIAYCYSNTARIFKGQAVCSFQIFLMAIGIVGFISFQFEWLVF